MAIAPFKNNDKWCTNPRNWPKVEKKQKTIHDGERNRLLNWKRKVLKEKDLQIYSFFSIILDVNKLHCFTFVKFASSKGSQVEKVYDRIINFSVSNWGKASDLIIDLLYFLP